MKQLRAFESGSVSFRLFYMQPEVISELLPEVLDGHGMPEIEKLGITPLSGWVDGMRLKGDNLTRESCVFERYVYLGLMQAERKIPPALLEMRCDEECEAELKARGADYLPKSVQSEIRQRVIEALKPDMPPIYTGIPVVADMEQGIIFAGAISDAQVDALNAGLMVVTGSCPAVMTAESAAMKRAGVDYRDLAATVFSGDKSIEPDIECSLGMDFLTWLWFERETKGDVPAGVANGAFSYMLDGPVTFFRERAGAQEAVIRKGAALNSAESAAALQCGKKIKKVKFFLAHGTDVFSGMVDDSFAFRGVKLPKIEFCGREAIFHERMRLLRVFVGCWLALFDRFIALRSDQTKWHLVVDVMRDRVDGM